MFNVVLNAILAVPRTPAVVESVVALTAVNVSFVITDPAIEASVAYTDPEESVMLIVYVPVVDAPNHKGNKLILVRNCYHIKYTILVKYHATQYAIKHTYQDLL